MFCHQIVQTKYNILKDEISKSTSGEASPEFLLSFVQVHMLDVISQEGTAAVAGTRENNDSSNDDDGNNQSGPPRMFFSDLYFGSYASSVMDSKRSVITQQELCTPFGFEMYFKIEEDDIDDDVIAETSDQLQRHDDDLSSFLYRDTLEDSLPISQKYVFQTELTRHLGVDFLRRPLRCSVLITSTSTPSGMERLTQQLKYGKLTCCCISCFFMIEVMIDR
ncbi:hypothetical protein IV203_037218 [Nitzschia inconspicua]|uniref:Uncharacterized protein n=1 Tax=Nitzschia inconspicua TaxID=303405 RepID=A0A9K3PYD2_9STRA|nr:hypothetical protein IV203_037218 [Nitzschia inconspicua]